MQVCHVPDYDKGQFVAALLQQTAQLKRLRGPETAPGRLTVDKKFGHFLSVHCQCYRMAAEVSGAGIDLSTVNFLARAGSASTNSNAGQGSVYGVCGSGGRAKSAAVQANSSTLPRTGR